MHMGSYSEAVARLQPAVPAIFDSLQYGVSSAAEDHARHRYDRSVDPHLFMHSARRAACERFKELGILATTEDGRRSRLQMSGIRLEHQVLHLWVLSSQDGSVPVPGRSRPRQQFWRQEPTLDGQDNLLLLWSDTAGKVNDPLYLIRPLGGDHRRKSLVVDWEGPLRRAMAGMRAADLDELQPDYATSTLGDANIA
jgi:hypothetical protein